MLVPRLVAAVCCGCAVTTASVALREPAEATVSRAGSAQAQRVDVALTECTITGSEIGDSLQGTPGDDVICGLGGNDTLFSSAGNDVFIGGDGLDWVWFGNATSGVKADLLAGTATGQGNDTLNGIENLYGSAYRDTFKGDSENYPDGNGGLTGNLLSGNGRGDFLGGRGGNDWILGYNGNDTIVPGPGDDFAAGDAGNDTISFKLSTGPVNVDMSTALATGQGTDSVYGENVIGSAFDDTITGAREGYGSNATDVNLLWGLAGNDKLFAQAGNDTVYGGTGDDAVDGGTGNDICDGGPDTDTATTCETLVSIP